METAKEPQQAPDLKRELQKINSDLKSLMSEDNSLSGYLALSISSELGWMVKIGYVIAIIFSILLFYCGYHFFTSVPDTEVFWGVCLIMSFIAQVTTKLWLYMQANRSYLSKQQRILAVLGNR
jgi:hypothetical protein